MVTLDSQGIQVPVADLVTVVTQVYLDSLAIQVSLASVDIAVSLVTAE